MPPCGPDVVKASRHLGFYIRGFLTPCCGHGVGATNSGGGGYTLCGGELFLCPRGDGALFVEQVAGAALGGAGSALGGDRGPVARRAARFAGNDGAGEYVRQRGDAGGGPLDGHSRPLAADGDGGGPARPDPHWLRGFSQDDGGAAAGAMGAARVPTAGLCAPLQPAAMPGGAEAQWPHSARSYPPDGAAKRHT